MTIVHVQQIVHTHFTLTKLFFVCFSFSPENENSHWDSSQDDYDDYSSESSETLTSYTVTDDTKQHSEPGPATKKPSQEDVSSHTSPGSSKEDSDIFHRNETKAHPIPKIPSQTIQGTTEYNIRPTTRADVEHFPEIINDNGNVYHLEAHTQKGVAFVPPVSHQQISESHLDNGVGPELFATDQPDGGYAHRTTPAEFPNVNDNPLLNTESLLAKQQSSFLYTTPRTGDNARTAHRFGLNKILGIPTAKPGNAHNATVNASPSRNTPISAKNTVNTPTLIPDVSSSTSYPGATPEPSDIQNSSSRNRSSATPMIFEPGLEPDMTSVTETTREIVDKVVTSKMTPSIGAHAEEGKQTDPMPPTPSATDITHASQLPNSKPNLEGVTPHSRQSEQDDTKESVMYDPKTVQPMIVERKETILRHITTPEVPQTQVSNEFRNHMEDTTTHTYPLDQNANGNNDDEEMIEATLSDILTPYPMMHTQETNANQVEPTPFSNLGNHGNILADDNNFGGRDVPTVSSYHQSETVAIIGDLPQPHGVQRDPTDTSKESRDFNNAADVTGLISREDLGEKEAPTFSAYQTVSTIIVNIPPAQGVQSNPTDISKESRDYNDDLQLNLNSRAKQPTQEVEATMVSDTRKHTLILKPDVKPEQILQNEAVSPDSIDIMGDQNVMNVEPDENQDDPMRIDLEDTANDDVGVTALVGDIQGTSDTSIEISSSSPTQISPIANPNTHVNNNNKTHSIDKNYPYNQDSFIDNSTLPTVPNEQEQHQPLHTITPFTTSTPLIHDDRQRQESDHQEVNTQDPDQLPAQGLETTTISAAEQLTATSRQDFIEAKTDQNVPHTTASVDIVEHEVVRHVTVTLPVPSNEDYTPENSTPLGAINDPEETVTYIAFEQPHTKGVIIADAADNDTVQTVSPIQKMEDMLHGPATFLIPTQEVANGDNEDVTEDRISGTTHADNVDKHTTTISPVVTNERQDLGHIPHSNTSGLDQPPPAVPEPSSNLQAEVISSQKPEDDEDKFGTRATTPTIDIQTTARDMPIINKVTSYPTETSVFSDSQNGKENIVQTSTFSPHHSKDMADTPATLPDSSDDMPTTMSRTKDPTDFPQRPLATVTGGTTDHLPTSGSHSATLAIQYPSAEMIRKAPQALNPTIIQGNPSINSQSRNITPETMTETRAADIQTLPLARKSEVDDHRIEANEEEDQYPITVPEPTAIHQPLESLMPTEIRHNISIQSSASSSDEGGIIDHSRSFQAKAIYDHTVSDSVSTTTPPDGNARENIQKEDDDLHLPTTTASVNERRTDESEDSPTNVPMMMYPEATKAPADSVQDPVDNSQSVTDTFIGNSKTEDIITPASIASPVRMSTTTQMHNKEDVAIYTVKTKDTLPPDIRQLLEDVGIDDIIPQNNHRGSVSLVQPEHPPQFGSDIPPTHAQISQPTPTTDANDARGLPEVVDPSQPSIRPHQVRDADIVPNANGANGKNTNTEQSTGTEVEKEEDESLEGNAQSEDIESPQDSDVGVVTTKDTSKVRGDLKGKKKPSKSRTKPSSGRVDSPRDNEKPNVELVGGEEESTNEEEVQLVGGEEDVVWGDQSESESADAFIDDEFGENIRRVTTTPRHTETPPTTRPRLVGEDPGMNRDGKPPWREIKQNSLPDGAPEKPARPDPLARAVNCVDGCTCIRHKGHKKDGVYAIPNPPLSGRRGRSFSVGCEMDKDGSAWTVIQRRVVSSHITPSFLQSYAYLIIFFPHWKAMWTTCMYTNSIFL